jgi:very-short-patch-repair endonuclease
MNRSASRQKICTIESPLTQTCPSKGKEPMFNFTPADLRRNPTVGEQILWKYLRARQMLGLKFRRQHPLGPFIADFVCLSKRIIVEMDGPIHDSRTLYDQRRDQWLRSQGFTVWRIKNEELEQNTEKTLMELRKHLLGRLGF